MTRTRGLILDRDGVVNIDTGYLHRIEECRFVDGIFDLARLFAGRGFRLAIATNQSGIGRGYFTAADFDRLMGWMQDRFRAEGVEIDRIYHAPEHPDAVPSRPGWRKPGPGMLLQAIADLDLDPAQSWAIGDHPRDLMAAEAAGIAHRVLLDPAVPETSRQAGHWIVPRLAEIGPLLQRTVDAV
ncbi:MAG TPA: HAD family hydrolase [Aliidongia sp.]|nr:HAD family hydrolase [Aliidongia sp.]